MLENSPLVPSRPSVDRGASGGSNTAVFIVWGSEDAVNDLDPDDLSSHGGFRLLLNHLRDGPLSKMPALDMYHVIRSYGTMMWKNGEVNGECVFREDNLS